MSKKKQKKETESLEVSAKVFGNIWQQKIRAEYKASVNIFSWLARHSESIGKWTGESFFL